MQTIKRALADLALVEREISNLRFDSMDQNPKGIRDLLYSAVGVLKKHHEAEEAKSGEDSDLAVALGEHAFKAGWDAGHSWAMCVARDAEDDVCVRERMWSEYDPPEELKGRAF